MSPVPPRRVRVPQTALPPTSLSVLAVGPRLGRSKTMMKHLIAGSLLLVTSTAAADKRPPVPLAQWTPQTRLWLARAMVAEAGFDAEQDHRAIAFVLARRWERVRERWSSMRLIDVIRNYCAGLGSYRRSITPRQRWVRALRPDLGKPEGWPARLSWERHQPLWQATLERVDRFSRGELEDPCRGRAWHWGGVIDSPRGRMDPIDCGETHNTFYRLWPRGTQLSATQGD